MIRLDDVLLAVNTLPSLPAVVLELIASIDDDDIDIDVLSRKIALDQSLSATTLRLANSSFYGMQRQVTSVQVAVPVLGLRTVRHLATTAALLGSMRGNGNPALSVVGFWRHSIGTALSARALAARVGISPDSAYTAGLVHDIGRLLLATRFAAAFEAVAARHAIDGGQLIDAERRLLGFDHAQLGGALTRHWKFPDAIVQATQYHHAPEPADSPTLALLVHAADAIAHALDPVSKPDALALLAAQRSWCLLKVDEQVLLDVFKDVEAQFEATCSILEGPGAAAP